MFAKNQMEIAVEPGQPEARHDRRRPRASPDLIVVLCASEAPCGKYADQLLEQNNVTVTPKSRELDAKSTLAKVESGDADAAIVYVTDVKGAGGKVDGVDDPDEPECDRHTPDRGVEGHQERRTGRAHGSTS